MQSTYIKQHVLINCSNYERDCHKIIYILSALCIGEMRKNWKIFWAFFPFCRTFTYIKVVPFFPIPPAATRHFGDEIIQYYVSAVRSLLGGTMRSKDHQRCQLSWNISMNFESQFTSICSSLLLLLLLCYELFCLS